MLSVPLQELVVRGALQGFLHEFLSGRGRLTWAIVLSNLMFSTAHVFISPFYSYATFGLGLFWGVLYARQGTLVGVSVSHAIVGIWSIFVLGTRGFVY